MKFAANITGIIARYVSQGTILTFLQKVKLLKKVKEAYNLFINAIMSNNENCECGLNLLTNENFTKENNERFRFIAISTFCEHYVRGSAANFNSFGGNVRDSNNNDWDKGDVNKIRLLQLDYRSVCRNDDGCIFDPNKLNFPDILSFVEYLSLDEVISSDIFYPGDIERFEIIHKSAVNDNKKMFIIYYRACNLTRVPYTIPNTFVY